MERISPRDDELRRRRHRLRDIVLAHPQDLALRSELAAVYRAEHNLAQAGRWDYLSDDADPVETAAFARAFRHDPVAILRALRWTGTAEDAATPVARQRLTTVQQVAQEQVGRPVPWQAPAPDAHRGAPALGLLAAGVALLCLVVGAVTIVRWVIALF